MKLRPVGPSELVHRGRQELSKWLERSVPAARGASEPRPALTLERFRAVAVERFFEGVASEQTVTAPSARVFEETMALVDSVRRKRFDLLGHRQLFFGDPVDWHLDPVGERRAPVRHWSRVRTLDRAVVGDSKVVWELNRHQWLVQLGQAYRWTGDESHAETFARCIREWMRGNPPGIGINWASSLEVALRSIAWCWALMLFRHSAAMSPELFDEIVETLGRQAAHVERYLSYYFSPNTHLTGEALGLFYVGTLFRELAAAERWRALGARILIRESERQIFPDGVYFEQSTCYQRYTAETYLHFLILAARNGVALPAEVGERVERMLNFFLAVRSPDGSMPMIGDADGGWLLPLARRTPDDFRGVFSTASAWFRRPDYAWAAGGVAAETLWLLGAYGADAIAPLAPTPPSLAASHVFEQGGYVVMRSGWEADAHRLIFDVGPLGCPVSGGHGHADLLSIQCAAFGAPYLIDAGTYGYTAEPDWRDFFRSTAAHSAVVVDGASQAIPDGPFAWRARPTARLRRRESTPALEVADGEHDGYTRLPNPVRHRRRIIFVKRRYWIVIDDLLGTTQHDVEIRFQFAPLAVGLDVDRWARARRNERRGLLIRAFADVELKAELREGDVAPIQGWVSPDYGRRVPAPVLIYAATVRLPFRAVTLLLPVVDTSATAPALSWLTDDRAQLRGVGFEDDVVTWDEETVTHRDRR